MREEKSIHQVSTEVGEVKLQFRDLATSVMATWERSGFAQRDLEDAFGSGDWAGLPDEDDFRELAQDIVKQELKGQPETELRRLMQSRLYRQHMDATLHAKFQFFDKEYDEDRPSRAKLLAAAVWGYLESYLADQWNKRILAEPELDDDAENVQYSLAL